MVRRLTAEKERAVLSSWMEGDGLKKVSSRTGVSVGKISEIIEVRRMSCPDLDKLRTLNKGLIESRISIDKALVAVGMVGRLVAQNISLDSLELCVKVSDKHGGQAPAVIERAGDLMELEKSTGRSYSEIVRDAEDKANDITRMDGRLLKLRSEEVDLKGSISELERLRSLDDKMGKHGIRHDDLDNFIDSSLKLVQLGFTSETAKLFAQALNATGLALTDAINALTTDMKTFRDLKKEIADLQGQKAKLEGDVTSTKENLAELSREEEGIKGRIESSKASYERQSGEQSYELQRLKKEQGILDADIRRLKDEEAGERSKLEEIKAEVERVDVAVEKNLRLKTVISLMETPEYNLDQLMLLEVILVVLEGLDKHLRSHPKIFLMAYAIRQGLTPIIGTLQEELRRAEREHKR